MLETVFDQKSDVALLSQKIRSKYKEMKTYLKIRVEYDPSKKKFKENQKYESSTNKQE